MPLINMHDIKCNTHLHVYVVYQYHHNKSEAIQTCGCAKLLLFEDCDVNFKCSYPFLSFGELIT